MSGKGEWVNLRFPNAFAHPFSFQGRDGGNRERMLVTIPKGVVLEDGQGRRRLEPERARDPVGPGPEARGPSGEHRTARRPNRRTVQRPRPQAGHTPPGRSGRTVLRPGRASERDVRARRPSRPIRTSDAGAAWTTRRHSMDGPAGDEGMRLFNDLAFDSGFVARMDTFASRFADDFAHGRYDAGAALRETRSLVAEAAMLMETLSGVAYGAGAADCAASPRAVRGDRRGQRICRRSRGSERLRSAGRGREPCGTLRGSPCAARYAAVPAHVHHRVWQDR